MCRARVATLRLYLEIADELRNKITPLFSPFLIFLINSNHFMLAICLRDYVLILIHSKYS